MQVQTVTDWIQFVSNADSAYRGRKKDIGIGKNLH